MADDPPPGFTRKDPAAPPQGFSRKQLFQSGPLRFFDDLTTSAMDAATRGLGNKLFGPKAQQQVETAKANVGGWHWPGDIAASVATAPYKVGSTAAGAGLGALEGGLTAYGHQKDWVPGWDESMEIGRNALAGGVLGATGAKLGEVGTNIYSKLAKTQVPNPTAGAPNLLGKAASYVEPWAITGRKSFTDPASYIAKLGTESILSHFGVPPGVTTGAATATHLIGNTGLGRQSAMMANAGATGAARDALTKMLIGMERSR